MIKKIAFVAHPTRDIAAAREFFGETLGLPQSADFHGKWVEFETPDGKSIAVETFSAQQVDDLKPYLALETDDLDAEVERLRARGVPVVMEPWTNEDGGKVICKMAIMLHEIAAWRANE